ncbi:MAG: DoxX family protein [Gammaproteobacteria bacterium]
MEKVIFLVGRILIGQLFLLAGINKIFDIAGTQGYMEAMGVPGELLPLVIILEIGGAIALIVGWKTRWTAGALAVFSISAAFVFHANFTDQVQMVMFMKNIAIAGGLMFIAAHGVSRYSLDGRLAGRNRSQQKRDTTGAPPLQGTTS